MILQFIGSILNFHIIHLCRMRGIKKTYAIHYKNSYVNNPSIQQIQSILNQSTCLNESVETNVENTNAPSLSFHKMLQEGQLVLFFLLLKVEIRK